MLEKRGFTDDNALFGHSTCPDEINHEVDGLPSLMEKTWGEVFYMGGLGGVPFCGKIATVCFIAWGWPFGLPSHQLALCNDVLNEVHLASNAFETNAG